MPTMPVEPPPSRWAFPPLDGAEPDGPVAMGGDLAPGTLLEAYRHGLFPMPVGRRGRLAWYSPDPRAVLPTETFRPSRSLRQSIRRMEVTADTCFREVVLACAAPTRANGWISDEVVDAYCRLHDLGWAHSVEAWQDGELAGGLYGVSIGAFFAGESMFHRRTDGSKVALARLVELMRPTRHPLLDVQWLTPHLARLGAVEVPRSTYLHDLDLAVAEAGADFA
jgi:leucyl/phenylalanyl-tRNA--protein transferase